jgi:phage terminase small subunit
MSDEPKKESGASARPKTPRLKPRHRKFVAEYMKDLNATQAAIRAGYKAKNADAHSYRLLRRPDIAAALDQLLETRRAATRHMSVRVLMEYMRIAFADMRDFADWGPGGLTLRDKAKTDEAKTAAISELVPSTNGKGAKVKLYDKKAALDALARHLGLFDASSSLGENRTVNGRDSRDVLRERLFRILGKREE